MNSNDFIFHCADVIKADRLLSEETIVIMFLEYKKKVLREEVPSDWIPMKEKAPEKYGRYEVYRQGCKKQCYQVWNGIGWSSDNDITHYREIKPPKE